MTIREIAAKANVSIATVSRVLNNDFSAVGEDKKVIIQDIAKKNGYVPKNKAKKEEKKVALVIPEVEHMFFAKVIRQIDEYCLENGLNLSLYCSDNDSKSQNIIDILVADTDIEWILYMGFSVYENNWMNRLFANGKKVVLLDNIDYDDGIPVAVFVDGEKGMYQITSYLCDMGHKNIAYFTGSKQAKFNNNRHVGYSRALFERNITVDPELTRFGYFTFESGYSCAKDLLAIGKPFSAVVCENDMIACGAIKAFSEAGLRVPDDVSITGFDDTEFSRYMIPALTTVRQPMSEIVEKAFELLQRMSKGESLSNCYIRLAPELVIRDSVKKI